MLALLSEPSIWLFPLIILAITARQYSIKRTRNRLLACLQIKEGAKHVHTMVQNTQIGPRQLFPETWSAPAEIIITEKAICCFQYVSFRGTPLTYTRYNCLLADDKDKSPCFRQLPFYYMNTHVISSLQIEGRKVTMEFEARVADAGYIQILRTFHIIIRNLEGNDAYRNLLLFQRRRHQILQQKRMARG